MGLHFQVQDYDVQLEYKLPDKLAYEAAVPSGVPQNSDIGPSSY